MQLKATDSQGKNYRVFLDGRLVPYALSADEGLNGIGGWVEVVDTKFIGMIAPIDHESSKVGEVFLDEIEVKTKKLFGKVELKMIPLPIKNK